MRSGDHSYLGVQLAAWKVTKDRLPHRYFPAKFLKLVTTPILTERQPINDQLLPVKLPRQQRGNTSPI